MTFFTETQIALQRRFDSARLAKVTEDKVIDDRISDKWRLFIEARDMLFMSSVDDQGRPACSYKGGPKGFVTVQGAQHLAFPLYDGNGLFISAGNLNQTGKIELLFIDFEEPLRLRVGGSASVREPSPDEIQRYPECKLMIHVAVQYVYVNCKRYVHPMRRVETSEFVPVAGRDTPIAAWKLLPYVVEHLPQADLAEIERRRRIGAPLPTPAGQPEKPQ
jgi:predicted pyridoxine 5'-phosphate oxidase superfamily flavin-nucleotide-binding protein